MLSPFKAINAATFTVLNAADSGPGSLRQAVLDANGTAAADSIAFAIPGRGPHTITLHVNSSAVHSSYPLSVHFYGAIDGSGALYLGEHSYTTPAVDQTALVNIPAGAAVGFVVATATDAQGKTSQFSAVLDVDKIFDNGMA